MLGGSEFMSENEFNTSSIPETIDELVNTGVEDEEKVEAQEQVLEEKDESSVERERIRQRVRRRFFF